MEWQATLDEKLGRPRFRTDTKKIEAALVSLGQDALEGLAFELAEKGTVIVPMDKLSNGGTSVELSSELGSIGNITRTGHTREYTPKLIESAFGFGRISYGALEHVY